MIAHTVSAVDVGWLGTATLSALTVSDLLNLVETEDVRATFDSRSFCSDAYSVHEWVTHVVDFA
jgi:hypothetical protein